MAASQASGSTQCWDSLEPAGYSGSWNFTGSGRILDLPFRRLGGQDVEDDCRGVILVRLSAEPLHEVSECGGLHTSDLFRGVRLFPVPVVVFLSTAHHQLRAPGEKLVLVWNPISDQKIESGFSFVGVSDHPRGELGPLSRVLGDEPLRGGPDLGGRAPLKADRVPDPVRTPSVACVHRHDFGGNPVVIADLGLDLVANPKFKNHAYLLLTVFGYFSFVTRCSRGIPLESTHFRVENHTNSCFSGREAGSSKISCSIPCSHGLTTCRVAVIRCSGVIARPPQTCQGPCNSDP